MTRLALLATSALFPLAAHAQFGLPAGAGMLTTSTGSSGSCPQGSAYVDGCPGAPNGTRQFPTILSGYTTRPPFNVPGIDYYVGVPAGTTLVDPSTISMSGVTVNAGTHTVTITGNNVTLSGINFGLDNGWQVLVQGAGDIIENSLFTCGSNQSESGTDGNMLDVQSTASNFTLIDDEFNGNSVPVTSQAGQMISFESTGSAIVEYDYFHSSSGDMIDFEQSTWTDQEVKYNLFANIGYTVDHSDTVQWCGSGIAQGHIDFNTVYQPQSGLGGEGLLVLNSECTGAAMANVTNRDNTLISKVSDNFAAGQTVTQDAGTATGNHNATYDNYVDPTGINAFTGSPWFPTGFYTSALGTPGTVHGMTNMVSGAAIPVPTQSSPTSQGYYVYPDSNGYSPCLCDVFLITPSPATGNITTGNTITFSVLFDAAQTVTGTPALTLNDGGTAFYVSGTGTKTLVYSHVVSSGNSASTLAVTAFTGTLHDDVGNATTTTPLTNLTTIFAGLSVNNTTPMLAFTSLPSGNTSSTVAISGTYTITAPSGLTNGTYGNGCAGAATITGFSASGGTWHATATTPATACTGTLTVTGTGGNTNTATSPSASFTVPSNAITFTSLNSAQISSTTAGSGGYTGTAPTGLTSATYGGTCSGSSTVSGFSASGGSWSATFTTPSAACTGPLTVTAVY